MMRWYHSGRAHLGHNKVGKVAVLEVSVEAGRIVPSPESPGQQSIRPTVFNTIAVDDGIAMGHVLGHVYRQLDELPHRGDQTRAAGQRHHAGHAQCAARPI
jgi:hypothetical protein